MCVPILRSIGTKLTNLENMPKSCIFDAKTLRHASCELIDRYFDQEHFEINWNSTTTSGSKVMAQTVVFLFSVTLTLTFDICSIFWHTHLA